MNEAIHAGLVIIVSGLGAFLIGYFSFRKSSKKKQDQLRQEQEQLEKEYMGLSELYRGSQKEVKSLGRYWNDSERRNVLLSKEIEEQKEELEAYSLLRKEQAEWKEMEKVWIKRETDWNALKKVQINRLELVEKHYQQILKTASDFSQRNKDLESNLDKAHQDIQDLTKEKQVLLTKIALLNASDKELGNKENGNKESEKNKRERKETANDIIHVSTPKDDVESRPSFPTSSKQELAESQRATTKIEMKYVGLLKKLNRLMERIGVSQNADKEDLCQIAGIDEIKEKKLNKIGIYRFAQLIALKKEDMLIIEQALELEENSIQKGQWLEQARAFF